MILQTVCEALQTAGASRLSDQWRVNSRLTGD